MKKDFEHTRAPDEPKQQSTKSRVKAVSACLRVIGYCDDEIDWALDSVLGPNRCPDKGNNRKWPDQASHEEVVSRAVAGIEQRRQDHKEAGGIARLEAQLQVESAARMEAEKEAAKKAEEKAECVICMDASSSHLLVPCGHYCLCKECAESKLNPGDPCPVCRVSVQSVVEVFAT